MQYSVKYTEKVAFRFKKFNLVVAFETSNVMSHILYPKIQKEEHFCNPEIYKTNCSECDMFYMVKLYILTKNIKTMVQLLP